MITIKKKPIEQTARFKKAKAQVDMNCEGSGISEEIKIIAKKMIPNEYPLQSSIPLSSEEIALQQRRANGEHILEIEFEKAATMTILKYWTEGGGKGTAPPDYVVARIMNHFPEYFR